MNKWILIFLFPLLLFSQRATIYVDTLKVWDGAGRAASDYNAVPANNLKHASDYMANDSTSVILDTNFGSDRVAVNIRRIFRRAYHTNDFGASTSETSANNTAYIQECIDSAYANYGYVVFSGGYLDTFLVDSLELYQNIEYVAYGAVLKQANNTNSYRFIKIDGTYSDDTWIKLSGLNIDYNSSNNHSGSPSIRYTIRVDSIDYVHIENITLRNNIRALEIYKSDNVDINYLKMYNSYVGVSGYNCDIFKVTNSVGDNRGYDGTSINNLNSSSDINAYSCLNVSYLNNVVYMSEIGVGTNPRVAFSVNDYAGYYTGSATLINNKAYCNGDSSEYDGDGLNYGFTIWLNDSASFVRELTLTSNRVYGAGRIGGYEILLGYSTYLYNSGKFTATGNWAINCSAPGFALNGGLYGGTFSSNVIDHCTYGFTIANGFHRNLSFIGNIIPDSLTQSLVYSNGAIDNLVVSNNSVNKLSSRLVQITANADVENIVITSNTVDSCVALVSFGGAYNYNNVTITDNTINYQTTGPTGNIPDGRITIFNNPMTVITEGIFADKTDFGYFRFDYSAPYDSIFIIDRLGGFMLGGEFTRQWGKPLTITDNTDAYSFDVASDKLTIYNDRSTPQGFVTIDSSGTLASEALQISADDIITRCDVDNDTLCIDIGTIEVRIHADTTIVR